MVTLYSSFNTSLLHGISDDVTVSTSRFATFSIEKFSLTSFSPFSANAGLQEDVKSLPPIKGTLGLHQDTDRMCRRQECQ